MANLLHVLTVFGLLSTAFALNCYQCDSSESKLCNYGLTSSLTASSVDCSQGGGLLGNILPKQCVKLIAKGTDGSEYVARGCMPAVGSTVCTSVASTLKFFTTVENGVQDVQCYTCDTDKCNSAMRYSGLSAMGVLLAVIAFLF